MSKYDYPTGVRTDRVCRESIKVLKQKLKVEERRLEDFIELTERIDMTYDARYAAIGAMYSSVRRIRIDLDRRLKSKVKKDK